jgi:hypothetical protein
MQQLARAPAERATDRDASVASLIPELSCLQHPPFAKLIGLASHPATGQWV